MYAMDVYGERDYFYGRASGETAYHSCEKSNFCKITASHMNEYFSVI